MPALTIATLMDPASYTGTLTTWATAVTVRTNGRERLAIFLSRTIAMMD